MSTKFLKTWAVFLLTLLLAIGVAAKPGSRIGAIAIDRLPSEARHTLVLIKAGGPFPYAKDGVVFHNYEGVLPRRRRAYYHEFTVKTPGSEDRGARRIIAGGEPASSGEYYYTDDHYATFRRVKK